MNARFDKPNELTVAWQVAPGYYLYRDKLTFAVNGRHRARRRQPAERRRAHRRQLRRRRDLPRLHRGQDSVRTRRPRFDRRASWTAGFQGCKDAQHLLPARRAVDVARVACHQRVSGSSAASAAPRTAPAASSSPSRINGCRASSTARGGRCSAASTWRACCCRSRRACCRWCRSCRASSRTRSGTVSTQRGFLLSLSYVLGMAATYTAAGGNRGARRQPSPSAVPEAVARSRCSPGMFVVLALGMFGVMFELQMPAAVQTRLANMANKQGRHLLRHRRHRRADRVDRDDVRRAAVDRRV